MEQPAGAQPRCDPRLVHPRASRMGFELHDRDRAHPYGSGLPFRGLQVSSRAIRGSLASFSAADDTGHGASAARCCVSIKMHIGGLGIGASIASHVPIIGPAAVKLMLGGPAIVAGATLSRFFAPACLRDSRNVDRILWAFIFWMVLKLGINEWPMPGRLVKKATCTRTNTTS